MTAPAPSGSHGARTVPARPLPVALTDPHPNPKPNSNPEPDPERDPEPAGPGGWWPAIRRSGDLLAEATAEPDRLRRFGLARLAVLQATWALCCEPLSRGRGLATGSPWALLAGVRPAFAEWALLFAAYDRRWSVLQRGRHAPDDREGDDLIREATSFRRLALSALTGPGTARVRRGSLP